MWASLSRSLETRKQREQREQTNQRMDDLLTNAKDVIGRAEII